MHTFTRLLVGLSLAAFSLTVLAHPAHPESASAQPLWVGMFHAFSGLDHLALLLVLALWLRVCGGARWPGVPLTAGMLVAALLLQGTLHGLVFDGPAAAPAFVLGLALGSLAIVVGAAIVGTRFEHSPGPSLPPIGRTTTTVSESD